MSTPEPLFNPITIYQVTGGTAKQQQDLMGCYFAPDSQDSYRFYDRHGKEKSTAPAGPMSTGKSFTFVMDGLIWTIHDFFIDQSFLPPTATGKWRASATLEHISHGHPGGEEDLTFQAQAGSHMDNEAASSANA